jgi:hypothetical protein
VDEAALLEQGVGVDQDVPEGAVLAAEPGREVADGLPPPEATEQLLRAGGIIVEIVDGTADEFLETVAQKFELRAVGPDQGAVGTDPVRADRRVF